MRLKREDWENVYKLNSGPANDQWYWTMNAYLPPPAGQTKGAMFGSNDSVAETPDEVCRLVEEAYLKMRHRAAKMGLIDGAEGSR